MRRYLSLTLELATVTLFGVLFVMLWVSPPPDSQPVQLETADLITVLFDPAYRNISTEHERLSGVLYPVKIGLEKYGHIPGWNPYMGMGEPIINNAFSYLFNPFHSLPVLLTESFMQGTKLATFIALLIAGYSMWAFAWAVGIGAVGRVMAGVLYMTCGSIAGKFHAGHFQLALSLAWPPLVLAGLWWTLHSRNRLAPVCLGVAFALLFFAGNIYYVLHTLICCVVVILVYFTAQMVSNKNPRGWKLVTGNVPLRRTILAFGFAFGLSAIQFIPVWLTRAYVIHDNQVINPDGTLEGHYSLAQTFTNLVLPWPEWEAQNSQTMSAAVDYAFIGDMVFVLIGLGGVMLAGRWFVQRRSGAHNWRLATGSTAQGILCGLILAPMMMWWATGQSSILQWMYAHVPLLAEFRFVGRALAIAGLWWIMLAAISADLLWQAARPKLANNRNRLTAALFVGLLAWGYFLIYSAANTSTRLNMVLYNYSLLNTFDALRFTHFENALKGLWVFLLVAVLLDTLLLVAVRIWQNRKEWLIAGQLAGKRLAQVAILGTAFLAMHQTMTINSHLYQYELAETSFAPLYPTIRELDTETPFPAINQPFSPDAYSAYAFEMRNWGLDEGWQPGAPPGLITWEAGSLPDLPRWAIVSRAYGEVSFNLSQQFVEVGNYEPRDCAFISPYPDTADPCDLNSSTTAVLYEKPDALPYAYVAPGELLTTTPDRLNISDIIPATVLSHEQDTISIQAEAPNDGAYYLIVQESHFPGWAATAGGEPIDTYTAETYHDLKGSRGVIAIPMRPGSLTYTLRFEPPGLALGGIITTLTVIAIGIYLIWGSKVRDTAKRVPADKALNQAAGVKVNTPSA